MGAIKRQFMLPVSLGTVPVLIHWLCSCIAVPVQSETRLSPRVLWPVLTLGYCRVRRGWPPLPPPSGWECRSASRGPAQCFPTFRTRRDPHDGAAVKAPLKRALRVSAVP